MFIPLNCEIMFCAVCLLECDKAVIRLAFNSDSGLTRGSTFSRHTLSSALIPASLTQSYDDYFPIWQRCV